MPPKQRTQEKRKATGQRQGQRQVQAVAQKVVVKIGETAPAKRKKRTTRKKPAAAAAEPYWKQPAFFVQQAAPQKDAFDTQRLMDVVREIQITKEAKAYEADVKAGMVEPPIPVKGKASAELLKKVASKVASNLPQIVEKVKEAKQLWSGESQAVPAPTKKTRKRATMQVEPLQPYYGTDTPSEAERGLAELERMERGRIRAGILPPTQPMGDIPWIHDPEDTGLFSSSGLSSSTPSSAFRENIGRGGTVTLTRLAGR